MKKNYCNAGYKATKDFTISALTELLDEKTKNKIKKALGINAHLTSCYHLQVEEVQDILGSDSNTSGFYFILRGTRCGVNFFLNNNMEIVRKPNKNTVQVKQKYSFFNDNDFSEHFWMNNF